MEPLKGKKILYLVTQSKYGGAAKYLLQLAQHFSENNQVGILVGEDKHRDDRFFREARSLGIEPVIVPSLIRDISIVKATEAVLQLRKTISKEQPDILHINSSMAGALGSCAAWLTGFDPLSRTVRVVYTAHGFVFNEPLTKTRRRIYLTAEKVSSSWKHAIITVSKFDKEQGIKHHIAPDQRMVVIHNGVDARQTFVARNEARDSLGIPDHATVIGTVASAYTTKGLPYLLRAFKILQPDVADLQLTIIGDGPEKKNLEALAHELQLGDSVLFTGALDNATELMKAFDVFALSSVKEGFPYVLLEAGLARLPVVATRVGGCPEIIEDGVTGLLADSANEQQLADALRRYITDSKLREQHSSALADRVRTSLTLDRMISETEKVYARLFPKQLLTDSK